MIPKELAFLAFFFFATGKKAGLRAPLFSHDSHRIDISHFFLLEKVELV